MIDSPYRVPLTGDAEPWTVVARLEDRPGSGALWGSWFGGGLILVRAPMEAVEPERAADGFDLLDRLPDRSGGFAGVGGGWLACLGYDADTSVYAFHDSLLRWTEREGWVFESLGLTGREAANRAALAYWSGLLTDPTDSVSLHIGAFGTEKSAAQTRDRHLAAVEDAIGRIGRGDFYQVNLCTRLHATTSAGAPAVFATMADRLRPVYGGLVCGSRRSVASFSPELFLRVHDGRVFTAPIKGTAPRVDDETDSPQLRVSAKDAAENVMIVDLMRNDLSRVCVPGTVAVPDLLGVEAHPGVWHLVSTVTGRLRPGVDTAELLTATFPPGSVTGAPKQAAVRAIGELEPEPRGAYTGAIGFVSPYAGAEWNVIIRTLEITGDRVELGVGGGITVDSVPIREWYECLHKAAPLVAAAGSAFRPELADEPGSPPAALVDHGVFESILVASGRPLRLAAHLARLDRSCRELLGAGLPDDLAASIAVRLAGMATFPRQALGVLARPTPSGLTVELTVRQLGPRMTSCTLAYADREARSWRHKWIDRASLEAAEAVTAPALPYFLGDRSDVAETSRGNLFLLGPDEVWRTPPLDEHVLPGVTRRTVLDLAPALGIDLRIERTDPTHVRAAFWTSSLSGAVEVTGWDGRPLERIVTLVDEVNEALGTMR